MHRLLSALLLVCASQAQSADKSRDPNADTLIVGRIVPIAAQPTTATAMAFDADGRILAIGDANSVRRQLQDRQRPLREIVVVGAVLPGLIDAHGHVLELGLSLMQADLTGTRSSAEAITRVRDKARGAPRGSWLVGRGWDQNDWAEKEFPTRQELDRAFKNQPVWLARVDGHAGWANSRALELAGIDRKTRDPVGGKILRGADGEPTGVLVDSAMNIMDKVVPAPNRDVRRRALRLAMQKANAAGLTGVHDAGVSRDGLALYRKMADNGELPLRIYAMADGVGPALDDLCSKGAYRHASERLSMRAVKLYADGALGSRGAALLEDYADDRGNRGLLIQPAEALAATVQRAVGCGMQPAVHAIGDRGNRIVLDAYAALDPAARAKVRPRIEHAQIVALDDFARFHSLGVIASVHPTHATSDMPWAQSRVGAERLRGAYAWRRFLDADVRLALGSDFPVERVDPLLGIYAAVTRQDADGKPDGGWLPDQRLTIGEALDGFTRGAAFAGFAEDEVGTLEVGKLADFVVLSIDPHQVRGRAITAIKVRSTWVGGKQVWP